MRTLVLIHRYLGVAVGFIVLLWCLSGFVMMYQSFPDLSRGERLSGLAPLDLAGCCDLSGAPLSNNDAIESFALEMVAGAPVLRVTPATQPPRAYDARTGRVIQSLAPEQALAVARDFARGHGLSAQPRHLGTINRDQWTVATARRNRPVNHLALGDPAGTEIYINGATGEVFQDANRGERALAWLGAIPHWLYPALLRQHPRAWAQVVIWSSIIGLFLAVTGICLGIARFLDRPPGRASPFRGLFMWHHLAGLLFGVLTLTWTFSGLLTMNPWGLLAGSSDGSVQARVTGEMRWNDVRRLIEALPAGDYSEAGVVQIRSAPLGGRVYAVAAGAIEKEVRLDGNGQPAPLGPEEVRAALAGSGAALVDFRRLGRPDAYYYAHHSEVTFPVYRAVFGTADRLRLYVDPTTGELLHSVDGNQGRDTLSGGDGSDRLLGGSGRDRLFGAAEADSLHGGEGDDYLDEGVGHGDLEGGMGNDILVGGLGPDAFAVDRTSGDDVIRDFTAGPGMFDHLALRDLRWEDLSFQDTAAGLRISWAGGSVLLEGVRQSDLAQDDLFADAPDLPPGMRDPAGPTAEPPRPVRKAQRLTSAGWTASNSTRRRTTSCRTEPRGSASRATKPIR